MKYLLVVIISLLFISTSCIPIISKDETPTRQTILSLVVQDNIVVTDPKVLKPIFGEGDGSQQMYRFFTLNLPDVLADSSTFDSIICRIDINRNKLHYKKLPWGRRDSLPFYLPSTSANSQPFDSTDYTLFIQDISLYGKSLFNYNLFLIGKGSFNIRPLKCFALYALWDNNKKELVTWGKIAISKKMAMTQCDWALLLHEFSGKVLDGTTFKKRTFHRSASYLDEYQPKIKDCSIKK